MVGGQIMIIFVGGRAFSVTRLNGPQWAYSLILGALSLPMAVIIRLIPDLAVAKLIPLRWRKRLVPENVVSDKDVEQYKSEKQNLTFIKKVRGGRLNQLGFKLDDLRDRTGYNDGLVRAMSGIGNY
jgi:Ca2+-transporting ATPase